MLGEFDTVVIILFVFDKQNGVAVLSIDDDYEKRRIVNKMLEFHPSNEGIENVFSGTGLLASLDIRNNGDPDLPQESRWGDLCVLIDRFGNNNETLHVIRDVFFVGSFLGRSDRSIVISDYDLKKCYRGGRRIDYDFERDKTKVDEQELVDLIKMSYSLL